MLRKVVTGWSTPSTIMVNSTLRISYPLATPESKTGVRRQSAPILPSLASEQTRDRPAPQ